VPVDLRDSGVLGLQSGPNLPCRTLASPWNTPIVAQMSASQNTNSTSTRNAGNEMLIIATTTYSRLTARYPRLGASLESPAGRGQPKFAGRSCRRSPDRYFPRSQCTHRSGGEGGYKPHTGGLGGVRGVPQSPPLFGEGGEGPAEGRKSVLLSRCGLRLLRHCPKRRRVTHRQVGQHLAVHLDPGLVQPTDEPRVAEPVQTGRRVDPLDP